LQEGDSISSAGAFIYRADVGITVADITAPYHPEGTAHQQWYHHGGRNNIICITGAMAVHRICATEHPLWTVHGQEPIQTSCEGLCS